MDSRDSDRPSAAESPSGVLMELSGILSVQAKKLERMVLQKSSLKSLPSPLASEADGM